MKKMCGRVVAHSGFAHAGVDHGVDCIADFDGLLSNNFVCAYALHGVIRACNLGHDRIVVVGVEPSAVADLASGFSVERSVMENDLAFVAGLEIFCALAV